MDKLKMQSKDKTQENFEILQRLFPNAVTETITGYDEDGKAIVERAIDKDVLQQEINAAVVEGKDERYQFTWPDKKRAIVSANAPINKTLRPCREESVDFDNTENLYIEGDNLEVLKLLQETYLGKIKMIYIDPPYNTGHDFVYNDKFSVSADEWDEMSGELDEYGNRLTQNTESNGRFHTDWLNMIYPRLKIARDLLSDDGVIFISIDNNEVSNAENICEEIFGKANRLGIISNINNPKGRSDDKFIATAHEYILIYSKNITHVFWRGFKPTKEITKRYNKTDELGKKYREIDLRKTGENDLREDRPNLFYYFYYNEETGDFFPDAEDLIIDGYIQIKPVREDGKEGNWRWGLENSKKQIELLLPKFMPTRKIWGVMQKDYLDGRGLVKPTSSWTFKDVNSERGTEEFIGLGFDKKVFAKPKPLGTIGRCITLCSDKSDVILDFFSGSATTAHAVMRQNAYEFLENKVGNRKFIMVQLPEKTDEKSEAYKAGYQNICEIGKERIRRAGSRIKEELRLAAPIEKAQKETGLAAALIDEEAEKYGEEVANRLDIGFRVLKLDSSNMKDVYYNPADFSKNLLDTTIDNIKEDRTPEDLLFQVMLDLGVLLSSKIEETEIAGKKVFNVADGFLIACFDNDVNEEVITAVAKQQPIYFVMRDSSLSTDTTATNFDQIFETYSPTTVRRVI